MSQRNTNLYIHSILGAIVFTILFYKAALGLNVFLFEVIAIVYFAIRGKLKTTFVSILSTILLILSGAFVVVTYSDFVIVMNFLTLLLFVGVHLYPEAKSLTTSLRLGLGHLFRAHIEYRRDKKKDGRNIAFKPFKAIKRSSIYLVPLIIIVVFLTIYRASNPLFDSAVSTSWTWLTNQFSLIGDNINFMMLFTFIFGLLLANVLVFKTLSTNAIERDLNATDILFRKRWKGHRFSNLLSLKKEYKAGVFLFICLNLLLLALNISDFKYVWFGFEWTGQTLKSMVHEGTYKLIFSILVSILLVLYYFRQNLNFYPHNKLLKTVAIAWIVQNGFLLISVGVRTFWYIKYFSLAHLRIGVFIFLILTFIGLITLIIKVASTKSTFFMFRVNALSFFIVLNVASFVDWDTVIAQYNVAHQGVSYFHMSYHMKLGLKTLDDVDIPKQTLEETYRFQQEEFLFKQEDCTPDYYLSHITRRQDTLVKKWESKTWRSWNLPEKRAYDFVKSKEE